MQRFDETWAARQVQGDEAVHGRYLNGPMSDVLSWTCLPGNAHGEYRDILYESAEGIAKITICRAGGACNAFRPQTLFELAGGL